jgi:virginiamycin B lyase
MNTKIHNMKQSERLKFRPVVASLEDRHLLAAPITEFSMPAGAQGIVAGPGDSLWFTLADDQIGRITLDGQVTTFSLPPNGAGPEKIAAGADGNLWFTYAIGPGIGRITPGGQYTEFAPGIEPQDIAAGPDGNLASE